MMKANTFNESTTCTFFEQQIFSVFQIIFVNLYWISLNFVIFILVFMMNFHSTLHEITYTGWYNGEWYTEKNTDAGVYGLYNDQVDSLYLGIRNPQSCV